MKSREESLRRHQPRRRPTDMPHRCSFVAWAGTGFFPSSAGNDAHPVPEIFESN
jgi:hypothetical protein